MLNQVIMEGVVSKIYDDGFDLEYDDVGNVTYTFKCINADVPDNFMKVGDTIRIIGKLVIRNEGRVMIDLEHVDRKPYYEED